MKYPTLLIAASSVLLAAEPAWYYQLASKPNVYLGYGEGKNESEAKQNALNDIASQIHTKIDTQRIQNQKSVNGNYEQNIEIKSVQNTKADMSDYELVKAEKIDDRFYVGIEYEDISNIDRFVQKVKAFTKPDVNATSQTQSNNLLQKSSLAMKLRKMFHKDIEFEVIRKENSWFLRYHNALQHISNSEFASFFLSHENSAIEIHTNKKDNILYDGDEFLFKVKSAQDGHVSILSLYEDGTVATLLRNIPIKKDQPTFLPDEKYGSTPVAGLIEKGKGTYDMYIVIYSKGKLMFDQFGDGSDENIIEERHKNVQELVDFLNDKSYATLKVVTRPR